MWQLTAGVLAGLAVAGGASAQMLDTMVAVGVADTLSSQNAGGMSPEFTTDRARNAVGAANANAAGLNAAMQPGGALPPMPGGLPPAGVGGLPPANAGAQGPGALPGLTGAPPPAAPGGAMTGVQYGGPAAPYGAAAAPGMPGAPGVAGAPTPTPPPMIRVLIGQRVYDAVTGALLEDAKTIPRPVTEQELYPDDGVHDNGIAGDGIRGNVNTVRDVYIGAETNGLKNRLIRVVREAEKMTPMQFFRQHVSTTEPYKPNPAMPDALEIERQRDELLKDWNNKFLADYRKDKDNPQSEFYELYVPEPPMPPGFPAPGGYVSPQKMGGEAPKLIPPTPVPGQPNIYNGDPVMGGEVPI